MIVQTASRGIDRIHRAGVAYQKCGVMLTDLTDRSHEQLDILADRQSDAERERSERLMATLDKFNLELVAGTVKLGDGRENAA